MGDQKLDIIFIRHTRKNRMFPVKRLSSLTPLVIHRAYISDVITSYAVQRAFESTAFTPYYIQRASISFLNAKNGSHSALCKGPSLASRLCKVKHVNFDKSCDIY